MKCLVKEFADKPNYPSSSPEPPPSHKLSSDFTCAIFYVYVFIHTQINVKKYLKIQVAF